MEHEEWIKQHLQVKRFWGESENAVRIQIHVAIITYCLIAIIEHDLKIGRPVFEVMRILGKSALTTDSIQDLFKPLKETTKPDDGQLYFDVTDCISSRYVILTCRFPLSSCVSSPSARQPMGINTAGSSLSPRPKSCLHFSASKLQTQQVARPCSVAARHRCSTAMAMSISP